jgi:hypothetical protein
MKNKWIFQGPSGTIKNARVNSCGGFLNQLKIFIEKQAVRRVQEFHGSFAHEPAARQDGALKKPRRDFFNNLASESKTAILGDNERDARSLACSTP